MLELSLQRLLRIRIPFRNIALRFAGFNSRCYLAYSLANHHSSMVFFVISGLIAIVSLEIEALAENHFASPWRMLLTSLGGGAAFILGSWLHLQISMVLVVLALLVSLVGFTEANIITIFISELFLSGTLLNFSLGGSLCLVFAACLSYYLVVHWQIKQPNWVPMTMITLFKLNGMWRSKC